MNSFTSNSKITLLKCVTAGFAVALLLLAVSAEVFLRTQIVPKDLFWRQVDLFFTHPSDDAAFGDSQLARGFTGTKRYSNFAYPADDLPQIRRKIDAYYKTHKPGRVILEAAPQLLFPSRLEEFPRDYDAIFTQSRPRYAPFGFYLLDGYYRSRLVAYVLRHGKTGEEKTELTPYGGMSTDWTAIQSTDNVQELERMTQARVKAHAPPYNVRQAPYARLYAEIVVDLKKRGATVCLVAPPVMPAYRDTVKKSGYAQRFVRARKFLQGLARYHGVRYVSYWDQINDPKLFINGDHLNKPGAERLTPRIVKDCFGN